jgi:hypothetical protein
MAPDGTFRGCDRNIPSPFGLEVRAPEVQAAEAAHRCPASRKRCRPRLGRHHNRLRPT